MARGGKRTGAGRKTGALTQKTRLIAEKAAEQGVTPLEVMLGTMRALWDQANAADEVDAEKAVAASSIAKDAAPYVHPRLASIEHGGKDGGPLVINVVRFARDNAPE